MSRSRWYPQSKLWSTFLIVLLILVAGFVDAQVSVEIHEARGTGAREREAVEDALQNAAFQLCGVTISSETSASVSVAVNDDGMKLVEQINDRIRVATGKDNCRFSGYELVGVTRDRDGGVRAHLRVQYSTYRVPGPPVERRRLQCSTSHWMRCTCTAPAVVASSAAAVAWFGMTWMSTTISSGIFKSDSERGSRSC